MVLITRVGYDPVEVGELPQLSDLSAHNEGDENSEDDEEDESLSAQGHKKSGGMFDTGDEEMEEELKNTLERLGIKIEDLEEDEDADADAQLDAADRDEDEKVEQRVRVKKFKVKSVPTEKQEPSSKKPSKCIHANALIDRTNQAINVHRIGRQGLLCHQVH